MDITRWIGVPVAVVAIVLGVRWLSMSLEARAASQRTDSAAQLRNNAANASDKNPREQYVLEILGLGVTLDKYRQGKLWDVLVKGGAYASIREQDPRKYDWTNFDKIGTGGGRICDAFENGAKRTPMYWGGPSFFAGPPFLDPTQQPSEMYPAMGVAGSTQATGMAWHLFINGPWQLEERPDRILEQVFAFFDTYPDVPYIVLSAYDGMGVREHFSARGAPPLVKDGYYIPEMPDAAAVFVLARRERVESLRPYVWTDPDNGFLQNEFRMMYCTLMESLPTEPKIPDGREPTIVEWLPAAAAFAKHSEFHQEGHSKLLGNRPWKNSPPKDWKPTPWFPIPWNRDQMETFDRLPSLGFLHRPTFVKFIDERGHPVTHSDQRQKILEEGWQKALLSLPDVERVRGPARIAAATDNNTKQLLALEGMLHHYATQGGPVIDTGKTTQFINTDRRLGNTGAATFFVQMALGVMGSYRDGGVSAALNLRDPHEASIVFISPPTDEKRKSQGEQFGHHVAPAIDPENYKAPSVEALLHAQDEHAASTRPTSPAAATMKSSTAN
jgi:hypothetical protein